MTVQIHSNFFLNWNGNLELSIISIKNHFSNWIKMSSWELLDYIVTINHCGAGTDKKRGKSPFPKKKNRARQVSESDRESE